MFWLANSALKAISMERTPQRRRGLFAQTAMSCRGVGLLLLAGLSSVTQAQERVRLPDSMSKVPIQQIRGDFNPFDPFAAQGIKQAQYSEEDIRNAELFDVLIEGNTTIPSSAILQRVESRPGRPPSPRVIQEDVARLMSLNWFFSVQPSYRVTEDGPVLVFQVRERPILRSVTFVGNKKIKTAELEAHTGLRKDHGFDPATNREAVNRIESLYRDKGYFFAKVTLDKGGDPQDRDVVIRIEEGKKVRIWDINFDGNSFVSDGVLKTKLSSKTVMLWVIGGEYDHDVVANDMYALKQYYMNLGFFDVKVDASEDIDPKTGHATINFQVDEGRRYKVGNIEIMGNEVLATGDLFKKQSLNEGDYFNARFLNQDTQAMKEQYDELGRLFAKVSPVPQFRQDDSGFVDLLYQIDEDTPRYIGTINVHIRGDHPHTQERVIRHQVTRFAKPGQLASGRALKMAQARVQNSPIWERSDPVAFDIRPVSGEDYMPPKTAQRGQDLDSGDLLETSQIRMKEAAEAWQPDWMLPAATIRLEDSAESSAFGHSLLPDRQLRSTAKPPVATEETRQETIPQQPSSQIPAADPPQQEMSLHGFGHSPLRGVSRPLAASSSETPAGMPVRQVADRGNAGLLSEPASLGIDPEVIFRAQSPVPPTQYRGQSLDRYGNPVPQNYLQGVSPQGDPFGDALSSPTAPGFVDLYIDATEGRTGRLMFGVGVNSDAGVVGSLVLQEDNFDILRPPRSWSDIVNGQAWRGAGQSFRLEAVPGNEVSRYLMSWQDPFFLDTDFSLSVSGFYYNRFYQEWTEDRLGGRIGLGYILDQYWSVGANLRMESVRMHGFSAPAPQDLIDVSGSNFLSTAGASITYDTRDSSFMPTRGHSVQFDYEQAFGEFNYPRLEVSGGQYFTLYERPDGFGKHVVQLRGQVGWTGDGTPIFERFYAGGYSSFRGFEFRGVTPREMGYRVGGNFMALGSAEYLIPITASDNVRAVVFSDFGTVEEDISLDQFRVTAGFGVRLTIPAMGPAPLAFDFAWPVTKQNEDNTRVFSFYIGFTR